MNWLLLNSGCCPPTFNMAMDEALLEAMPRFGQPVLRLYGWTELAATFGYFQKFAEVEQATMLRPLVRRPTGGGLVPHDADWTYSLAFPVGHEWHSLRAEESYRRVHEWIQAAFTRLGVETELASCSSRREEALTEFRTPRSAVRTRRMSLLTSAATRGMPGQCFVGHEKHDLLWRGRKIAGAAQRRNKLGLLIQGSVQPPPVSLSRVDWEQAMAAVEKSQPNWAGFSADEQLLTRVADLEAKKYSQVAYNQKR